MADLGRDRLRELLDAVLADGAAGLGEMATTAHASPFHFTRQVSAAAGEAPVTMRRRVLMERAAWQLQRGTSVTDAAWAAGYESVEGFARAFGRAFGCPPSRIGELPERGHWLPSPNGIHFHSPTVLYVDAGTPQEHATGDVLVLLARHDVADSDRLLERAEQVPESAWREPLVAGHTVLHWAGPEESLADVCRHLVHDKLCWTATLDGADDPSPPAPDDAGTLRQAHAEAGRRWVEQVADIERRGAWQDRVVDALCDPPESFLLSQVFAHVVTFAAHRRQLARWLLHRAGVPMEEPELDPDPIMWHRRQYGGS